MRERLQQESYMTDENTVQEGDQERRTVGRNRKKWRVGCCSRFKVKNKFKKKIQAFRLNLYINF